MFSLRIGPDKSRNSKCGSSVAPTPQKRPHVSADYESIAHVDLELCFCTIWSSLDLRFVDWFLSFKFNSCFLQSVSYLSYCWCRFVDWLLPLTTNLSFLRVFCAFLNLFSPSCFLVTRWLRLCPCIVTRVTICSVDLWIALSRSLLMWCFKMIDSEWLWQSERWNKGTQNCYL